MRFFINLKQKLRRLKWIISVSSFVKLKYIKYGMYIVKPSLVSISKTSEISIKRALYFNWNWQEQFNGKNPRNGMLVIGENARLVVDKFYTYWGSRIHVADNASLVIGGGYLNINASILCFESISIGHGVCIADGAIIRDSDNHSLQPGVKKSSPIIIKDHVWIGMNAMILKGVTIGEGAIVAAGSIVTKDVPAHTLVAGIPARPIKQNVDFY